MIRKIFNNFNNFLVLSFVVHILILIVVCRYLNQTKFIFESKQRNTKIEMRNVDHREIEQIKQRNGVAGVKKMHRGYKNLITSTIKMFDEIENVESTNTYQITHSKTKPMSVYNKPQSIFSDIQLNQSIAQDLSELETLDDEQEMTFVNGDRRGVVDSLHEELSTVGISINANVKLELVIDADGNVLSVKVVTSTGDITKDSQIENIVSRWKFETGDMERQTVIVNLKYFIN